MTGEPVAAVDCGTNSTRLLVLGGDGERLERRMTITRLGAGVDRTGTLSGDAVERTLVVLREYRQLLDLHHVSASHLRAAATSATRDAANAEDFLDPAEAILGRRPEVIEGEEEGRLSYLGATSGLDPLGGPYLVVDIGGGSTELILGRSPEPSSDGAGPSAVVSLDVGCVRLAERFLRHDPPGEDELAAAHEAARSLVAAVRDSGSFSGGRRLIGLAGTVSALTVMALGLDRFVEEKVHHARVDREQVRRLAARLASLPLEERRREPGMEPARADVIVGGAIVLEEVMDVFSFGEFTASESDILDGLAAELRRQGAA
ncbi:MAG TPA: Ppx/GppA phosphatase family protein [Acidimicrobiales bacterium]|nr:Ppx/GppA phosphatase family protein [Acidimicrobiales bacterium]